MARRIDPSTPAGTPETPQEWPFDSNLLTSLVRIVIEWSSLRTQGAIASDAGLAIDSSDVIVLFTLGRLGPQRPSQLAVHMKVTAPTVSKSIARLADSGMIRRVADPQDARSSVVVLTSLGSESAQRLFRQGDTMVNNLVQDWTPEDAATLTGLLERFADSMDASNRA